MVSEHYKLGCKIEIGCCLLCWVFLFLLLSGCGHSKRKYFWFLISNWHPSFMVMTEVMALGN